MRKKILYIWVGAILASFVSLFFYSEGNGCALTLVPYSDCVPHGSSRGFPIGIPVESSAFFDGAMTTVTGIKFFFADVLFYFIFFSAIYFGYSRLTKKAKKK